MINIYKNLQTAIARNDLTPIFFEMGKMFRLIVDFQPIEMEGFTKPLLQNIKESDVIRHRHQVFLMNDDSDLDLMTEVEEDHLTLATPHLVKEDGYK